MTDVGDRFIPARGPYLPFDYKYILLWKFKAWYGFDRLRTQMMHCDTINLWSVRP